jgi:c-di-GMP-related signal transduction protein
VLTFFLTRVNSLVHLMRPYLGLVDELLGTSTNTIIRTHGLAQELCMMFDGDDFSLLYLLCVRVLYERANFWSALVFFLTRSCTHQRMTTVMTLES